MSLDNLKKYLNAGSISAAVGTFATLAVAIHPSLGPGFSAKATAVVVALVAAITSLIGLIDEIVASFKSTKSA